jgi:DNA-directed RNA polymerase subunit RPC12/RpoP
MFLETKTVISKYLRPSKSGQAHEYSRSKTMAIFKCDNCDTAFERPLGSMDRKRLSNNYYHVCANCDAKRFAQIKGVEHRRLWNMSVDSDLKIGKL